MGSRAELVELGTCLEIISEEIKNLGKDIRKINRQYIPLVKNPLTGYAILFGRRALRDLGYSREPLYEYYRGLYFQDIKYRSKLRKRRDKISVLKEEYEEILSKISEMI